MKYSKELIQECIKVFAKENDHHTNEGTTKEYLDSLSELVLVFVDKNSN